MGPVGQSVNRISVVNRVVCWSPPPSPSTDRHMNRKEYVRAELYIYTYRLAKGAAKWGCWHIVFIASPPFIHSDPTGGNRMVYPLFGGFEVYPVGYFMHYSPTHSSSLSLHFQLHNIAHTIIRCVSAAHWFATFLIGGLIRFSSFLVYLPVPIARCLCW